VLGALFSLIIGCLVVSYEIVQSTYYVGRDHGIVAIFRGIHDKVLGFSLDSVYRPTSIPVSGIPAAAVAELRRADTGSLATAEQFLRNITRQYNTCRTAEAKLLSWQRNKPTKKILVHIKVNGQTRTVFRYPPYPPKPTIPAYCPPQTSA
jgi:hypothetical protein